MATNNNEVLLRVEHLRQYFGSTKAVDDVSFDIKKGEAFGLVGESGCGKTTTGRSIIKLYNITGGDIYFKGIRIGAGLYDYKKKIEEAKKTPGGKAEVSRLRKEMKRAIYDQKHCDRQYQREQVQKVKEKYQPLLAADEKNSELRREYSRELRKARKTRLVTQIQMIFQDPIASLNPRMTVREIIAEGLIIQGERDKKELNRKVLEMLDLVGLAPEYADRYPHEFSGGQRQRIVIARALAAAPQILILDDSSSALDYKTDAALRKAIREHHEDTTTIIVAQRISSIMSLDDIIVLDEGSPLL